MSMFQFQHIPHGKTRLTRTFNKPKVRAKQRARRTAQQQQRRLAR